VLPEIAVFRDCSFLGKGNEQYSFGNKHLFTQIKNCVIFEWSGFSSGRASREAC
jgi:hypothetical protein